MGVFHCFNLLVAGFIAVAAAQQADVVIYFGGVLGIVLSNLILWAAARVRVCLSPIALLLIVLHAISPLDSHPWSSLLSGKPMGFAVLPKLTML